MNYYNQYNEQMYVKPTPPGNTNYQQMALPPEQSYIENILRLNKGKR